MTEPRPVLSMLRLSLVEGVGPILGRRLLAAFGSAEAVFDASPAELERVEGIGQAKARRIRASMNESAAALEREVGLAQRLGVRVIGIDDPDYPPLLAEAPDAPLVLYLRGAAPCPADSFPLAVVGSRHCTAYGIEQAERFSAMLAQSGLVIVSGGARGIDSAAHRAAVRVGGTTVVVMGCGLANCYPPENAELFEQIVSAGGSVISELPLTTPPESDNFPARNRIIAAMSLGVLVIEAPKGSGALITARLALDDYSREVLAVPGRVDSRASEGSNGLIKAGEAALASEPADVLAALESAARHHHAGTHAARFGPPVPEPKGLRPRSGGTEPGGPEPAGVRGLSEVQLALIEALSEPGSVDDLCRRTGLEAGAVQAGLTGLEVRRLVVRSGSVLTRRNL